MIASFVIKVQEGSSELTKVLKMSAIGKYPFITLDQRSFDFETLLVGKTASQVFNLQNSCMSMFMILKKITLQGGQSKGTYLHKLQANCVILLT